MKIDNIDFFGKVDFKKLKYLNLNGNKINSIEIFTKVSFKDLLSLNLEFNQINNINCLTNFSFNKLNHLGLRDNKFNPKDERIKNIVEEFKKKCKKIDVVVDQPEKGPLGKLF